MIQLHVLTGAAAGQRYEANRFPVSVGRTSGCSLVLQDAGVFEKHFEIQFTPEGFELRAGPHAVVTVNGDRAEQTLLRNGDVIAAGFPKIQFWLGAMAQRGLRVRETLTWLLVAGVAAAQIYLLTRLLAIAR
jgi:pSer/pThr/pTyr-binding forkhead associated (FHA) protein